MLVEISRFQSVFADNLHRFFVKTCQPPSPQPFVTLVDLRVMGSINSARIRFIQSEARLMFMIAIYGDAKQLYL